VARAAGNLWELGASNKYFARAPSEPWAKHRASLAETTCMSRDEFFAPGLRSMKRFSKFGAKDRVPMPLPTGAKTRVFLSRTILAVGAEFFIAKQQLQ